MRLYKQADVEKYSVTSILEATKPESAKEALKKWRETVGEEVASSIRQNGSNVHKEIEDFINGTPIENPSQYFLQFKKGILDYLIENNLIIANEHTVFHDSIQFAGRIDCVCKYNFKYTILDWKTSLKPKKLRKFLDDYFIQCAAYAIAYEAQTGIAIERIAVAIATEETFQFAYENDVAYWKEKWKERFDNFLQLIQQNTELAITDIVIV